MIYIYYVKNYIYQRIPIVYAFDICSNRHDETSQPIRIK